MAQVGGLTFAKNDTLSFDSQLPAATPQSVEELDSAPGADKICLLFRHHQLMDKRASMRAGDYASKPR